MPCHYIERRQRIAGPSLSARLVRPLPGVHLYTQHRRWARPPWVYRGSVLDGFVAERREPAPAIRKVVVTVGATQSFGFRSLIERLTTILPSGADVLWQVGPTDVSGLDIDSHVDLPGDELMQAVAEADLVVAHAGVGSSLVALSAGRWPVLVPRRRGRNEHVDDHQVEIAADLAARGLALVREVDELSSEDLVLAASHRVALSSDPPAFVLAGS